MAKLKPKVKKKQKTWYSILSPESMGAKKITDTLSTDVKNLVGRTINVTLSDITGDFKHFHTTVKLKVKNVEDKKAITEYHGQSLITDKIARMVSRWKSRIDSIDDVKTKDGHVLRIKSLTISRRRVNTSVKSDLRNAVSKEITEYCKDKKLEEIVTDIFDNNLQKQVFHNVKGIYPLQGVEIRMTEVLK